MEDTAQSPDKLQTAIARAKREILADVASGTVPITVASYSELHDYVDANGYGGAFEDTPILADDDSNIEECWANTDFWNAVQDGINDWIAAGGLRELPQ